MEITEKVINNISVYSIKGQIKISTQEKCKEHFCIIIGKKSSTTVILNMSEVEYINNAGLGMILECFNKLKADGRQLILCGLQPNVAELFDMIKLDHLLEIFPDEESALKSVTED